MAPSRSPARILAQAFSLLGSVPVGGLITFGFDGLLYLDEKYAMLARVLTAQLATLIVIVLLKYLIQKPRSRRALVSESTYAFPSGHSGYALALYGGIFWYLWLVEAPITSLSFVFILPFAIGASRLSLRVHDTEDVLIGYLIASFFLWQMVI